MDEKTIKVRDIATDPATEPVQLTLDAFCRSVAQRIPAETLSVFYTTETAEGRSRATFDEFTNRLQDFMNAPLG
jgi:hypothetical protein